MSRSRFAAFFTSLSFFVIVALVAGAFAANLIFGQFRPGFENLPVALTDMIWNFSGMLMAGLAFSLAGGCPGRQLFLSGEGDSDAGIFVLGMIAGAALAHNFGLASSAAGPGPNGPVAVGIGLAVLLVMGFVNNNKA